MILLANVADKKTPRGQQEPGVQPKAEQEAACEGTRLRSTVAFNCLQMALNLLPGGLLEASWQFVGALGRFLGPTGPSWAAMAFLSERWAVQDGSCQAPGVPKVIHTPKAPSKKHFVFQKHCGTPFLKLGFFLDTHFAHLHYNNRGWAHPPLDRHTSGQERCGGLEAVFLDSPSPASHSN